MQKMPARHDTSRLNSPMLGLAAVVLMAVVGVSYREWKQYSRANADAALTRDIRESVDALLLDLVDAETGQRGFLLTGQDRYLEPYNGAVKVIPGQLAHLESLLASRTGESASVAQLHLLADRKLDELRQTIELRRTEGQQAAALVLSDHGKRSMDEIRALAAEIQRRAGSAQRQASADGEAAAETALLATAAGTVVLLFLFAFGLEPFASPDPQAKQRAWPIRYGAAALAVVAAVGLRMALTPLMGPTAMPFTLFFPVVWFAAWFGGLRPGLLSLGLSAMAGAYFFAEPTGSLMVGRRDDGVALLMLVLVGAGMALLSHSQGRAVERATRAEESERNARQRYETTLASIGDAVIATDAEGRITFANKVALSLVRWPESEAFGKHLDEVLKIVNEASRETVESPVKKVIREGAIVGLANHTILIARDGTEVPIDDSAAPIRGATGLIEGTVLVFRDITERRRAQATSQLLASIVESSDDAIISLDLNGVVTTWNKSAERLLGYSEAEMIGRRTSVLAPPGRSDETAGILERVGRGEHVDHFQTVRRTKSGKLFDASVTLSPIREASGRIIGASKILRDLTERIRMEEQRAELLAKDRVIASERALREKEAELARVVRALSVGELATSIAHEINQPLAGIVMHSEAARRWLSGETPNLEEVRESLALIAQDGNRASAVIQRIRDFLKKGSQQIASLSLNDVAQESIAFAEPELRKHQITLRTDFSSDLPQVQGDPIQLQQVILNLIMNGAEAMASKDGRRELVVSTERGSEGGVLVSVRDSGAGITPEEMPRMFEAFFTTKSKGMGMGLSISRTIVEAHGGRIWAEMNDGQGLTVKFELPAQSAVQAASGAS